jgi:hypothetical protein
MLISFILSALNFRSSEWHLMFTEWASMRFKAMVNLSRGRCLVV